MGRFKKTSFNKKLTNRFPFLYDMVNFLKKKKTEKGKFFVRWDFRLKNDDEKTLKNAEFEVNG